MVFDVQMHIYNLIQNKDYPFLAKWLWLEGFKELLDGKSFDTYRFINHVRSLQNPRNYYKFPDVDFENRYLMLANKGKLLKEYLPINDDYCLSLWVRKTSDGIGSYYKIHNDYILDSEQKYPVIRLGYNFAYKHSMVPKFSKRQINNLIDVFDNNIQFDVIYDSYAAIESLIKNCEA